MSVMRDRAVAAMEMASRSPADTRVLQVKLHQAEVYALLAIAEALEKLAKD